MPVVGDVSDPHRMTLLRGTIIVAADQRQAVFAVNWHKRHNAYDDEHLALKERLVLRARGSP
jgi:hypothetical protein